jgi:hypothetical protein
LTIPNDADEKRFEDTRQELNCTLKSMQETTPKLFDVWNTGSMPVRNKKGLAPVSPG